MAETLTEPCPRCGGEVVYDRLSVKCQKCGVEGHGYCAVQVALGHGTLKDWWMIACEDAAMNAVRETLR